jgi:hypothetical protein
LPFLALFDIGEHLPERWADRLDLAIREHAQPSVLVGGAPTSLEDPGTEIHLELLDGVDVAQGLPWLRSLYETTILELARRASGEDLIIDPSMASSVNVNVLPANGGGYELHVDSNPVTGLLFLSSHTYEDGGILEMEIDQGHWFRIPPVAGTFLAFDARRVPHRVTASRTGRRISAPMNFYNRSQGRVRPEGLDTRLYKRENE